MVAEDADLKEVRAIQRAHGLDATRILLMPLGMRREGQLRLMPQVIEWCRREGYRFSPRLHILAWGPKRGVQPRGDRRSKTRGPDTPRRR